MRHLTNFSFLLMLVLGGCSTTNSTPNQLVHCSHIRSDERCVTSPTADSTDEAAVRMFKTKPDVAAVYIFRSQVTGSRTRMPILLDGRIVAESAPRTFAYLEVSPGKHVVSDISDIERSLAVEVRGGARYFIEEHVTSFTSFSSLTSVVQSRLAIVDEDTGRTAVNTANTHLLRMKSPGGDSM